MDHQFRYLGFANFTSVFHMERSDFFGCEVAYVGSEVTYLMERSYFRVERSNFLLERSNHGAI